WRMASAASADEKNLPCSPSNDPLAFDDSGIPATIVANGFPSNRTSVKNRICGYTSITLGSLANSARAASSRGRALGAAARVAGGPAPGPRTFGFGRAQMESKNPDLLRLL